VLVVCVRTLRGPDAANLSVGSVSLIIGFIVLAILVIVLLIPDRKPPSDPDRVMVTGSGYPLPPLDLKVPQAPKRRRAVAPQDVAELPKVTASTSKETSDGDV